MKIDWTDYFPIDEVFYFGYELEIKDYQIKRLTKDGLQAKIRKWVKSNLKSFPKKISVSNGFVEIECDDSGQSKVTREFTLDMETGSLIVLLRAPYRFSGVIQ